MRRALTRVLCQARQVTKNETWQAAAAGQEQVLSIACQPWLRGGTAARSFASAAPQTRGPVSYMSLVLTVGTGAGLLWWYNHEKVRKVSQLSSEGKASVVVGQAAIGGPFDLVDHLGRRFTEANLLGHFSLLYFGFTWCPDICPDELEKIAAATDEAEKLTGVQLLPVFISVDPQRDGVAQVRDYVREFHPRMVGLTGPPDRVAAAAKAYRVYFSKTQDSQDDYLVDHSIITYLVDPQGKFVTFYGKNFTAAEMAKSIAQHIQRWQAEHPAGSVSTQQAATPKQP